MICLNVSLSQTLINLEQAAFIKLPLSKDHLDTNISNGEIKKEENSKEDEEEPSPEELNEMEYRDALKEDTRSFFQYFISIFAEKQIIVSTIVNHSVFYPLSLRLVLLLFTLTSFFFLNAILYTEEYITERYSTKESLDISREKRKLAEKCLDDSPRIKKIFSIWKKKFLIIMKRISKKFIYLKMTKNNWTKMNKNQISIFIYLNKKIK